MPTDLAVAVKRRQTERLFATQDEKFLLLTPTLIGVASALLAIRNPVFACALIVVGMQ